MKGRLAIAAAVVIAAVAGCDFGRHTLVNSTEDRIVRAESGDRFFLELDEGGVESKRWTAKSSDPDVTVSLKHRDGKAAVEMRVHRGFDGPATVTFTCKQRSGEPPKDFAIVLYKRTGDAAFWK